MNVRWLVGSVLTLALAACSSPPSVATDAGPLADAATLEPASPAPPASPASVVLEPCPAGWRATAGPEGVSVCDPWPASGASDTCAFDEAHFPGTPGCARVGTACATDGWPSDLPTGRPIVYVDDGAAAGGDGASRATALPTISAALAVAPSAAVIAIATGRYDERQLALRPGQTLWGACVDGTRLTSSFASDDQMLIDAAQTGVGLRNLAIDAPARFAIAITGGDVTVEDVVVERAHGIAFYGMTGTSTLRRFVVRDTEPVSDGRLGDGIWLVGGSATIEGAVLDHNREYALYLSPGSSADVSDLSARRTQPLSTSGYYGHGLGIEAAHLALRRAAIEDNLELGIELLGAARVELTDVVVDETGPGPEGAGWGVLAPEGATLTFDRLRIDASRAIGLAAEGVGASVEGRDLVVSATLSNPMSGVAGYGVTAQQGAHVTLTRALVAASRDVGVLATDPGSSLTLTDARVVDVSEVPEGRGYGLVAQASAHATLLRTSIERATSVGLGATASGIIEATDLRVSDTRSRANGLAGDGVVATAGGSVRIERGLVERSVEIGAIAIASMLSLTDVSVVDVASRADGLFGRGIEASHGATLALDRVHVVRAHGDGVFVGEPGMTLTATDVVVDDTRAQSGNLRGGIALQVGSGAHATIARLRIADAHMAGIAADGTAEITSVQVSGVRAAECATTTCPELSGGFGVVAQGGASVTLQDFVLDDAELCGVVVGLDSGGVPGAIDLHRGRVRRAPIGACVQVPGYDTERLHDAVEFVDVDVPLQATSYPLPSADATLTTGP